MEDFFANSFGGGGKKNRRNRIFGDIFAPPSYSPSGKVVRREEKDKERRGEEKKGAKADGKVWRPSPSPFVSATELF